MVEETTATRVRLLEAAVDVFSQQGFRNARVREICQLAETNIAAINYHFGDKKGLYDATLQHAFFNLPALDMASMDAHEDVSFEQRLKTFVSSFLTQLLGSDRTSVYTKLIARETLDPTDALDNVIQEGMRPQVDLLKGLVRDFLGSDVDEQFIRRCTGSILGQCMYFHFGRPIILGTGLEATLNPDVIDELADHVTQFSLAALREIKERKK